MSRLSIVIPAWNERDGIGKVVERILAIRAADWAAAGATDVEVIVVDDGSSDGTARAASEAARRMTGACTTVRVISHRVNRGYGAALQTGFEQARGDWLAFLDADSTYPPEHLPNLCRSLRRDGAALVVGDRMSGNSSKMPVSRWAGNLFFAGLVSLLAGAGIADSSSGMRVLTRNTREKLGPLPNGLDFTPAMTMRALHQRLQVREVSIPYEERVGRSKLKIVRDGWRFLATILRETWTYRRSRLWSVAVLIITLLSVGIALPVFAVQQLQRHNLAMGPALATLAVVAGLLTATLGVSMRTRPVLSRLALRGNPTRGGSSIRREEKHAS